MTSPYKYVIFAQDGILGDEDCTSLAFINVYDRTAAKVTVFHKGKRPQWSTFKPTEMKWLEFGGLHSHTRWFTYRSAKGAIENAMQLDPVGYHVNVSQLTPISDFYADYEKPTNQKDTRQMNTNEMITVMQLNAGATVVSGTYGCDDTCLQPYYFKNVLGVQLDKGDLAIVETRDEYQIIRVVDPNVRLDYVTCPLGDLKHVVQKIDTKAVDEIRDAENRAHHQLAMSEVTERLQKYREQLGDGTFKQVSGLLTGAVDVAVQEVMEDENRNRPAPE